MTIRTCTMRAALAISVAGAVSALGLITALASHVGSGQTTSGQMRVTATVPAVCTLQTNPLVFGTYDPTDPNPTQANTTTDVTCSSQLTKWEIEYDNGLNSLTGDCKSRRMSDGAAVPSFLDYNIFDGVVGGPLLGLVAQNALGCNQQAGIGSAVPGPVVAGDVPALQPAPPGTFSDVLTVTLHF